MSAAIANPLTAREQEVVKLVCDGKTNPEIATVLGLSPRTVETYRLRLMDKLGLANVPALVKWAIRAGLTTIEDGIGMAKKT